MNCLEIQRQLADSSSWSRLNRAVRKHLESCAECQGEYPARPALRSLLLSAWPEVEPDPRIVAAVRLRIEQEMDKPTWGFLNLDLSSLSFAFGVGLLLLLLGLPLLWMGSTRDSARSPQPALQAAERVQVRSALAGPFNSADPLFVTDSLTSLSHAARPQQFRPGAVVHVIYPFQPQHKPRKSVVHY
jgi:hypothetical protein